MNVDKLIDFLETDTLSVSFSPKGLKYLSLIEDKGEEKIDLRKIKEEKNPMKVLLVNESLKFLQTGSHGMPLDLTKFTAFQQDVFKSLSKIKKGQIYTYKGLGEMMGKPEAAQAIGSAVSKNPVSYFLPTHRVVAKKGIGICKSGAGFLREKLLILEGHDIEKLKGNYVCSKNKCVLE